jgi:Na+-translocating ferredoxin:NAD+ oxidoreductase RnfA subunit
MSYILILIGCVFVNNVVLSQFMGICPFLGVSKQMKSSVGMGAAVIFVMICATAITYPVYRLLEHFGIEAVAQHIELAVHGMHQFITLCYEVVRLLQRL